MMSETGPRWSISNIRLTFADIFIALHLWMKLSINDTCTLRCDDYHLINEVWPSANSFSEVKLSQILQYMTAVLSSYTEDQWYKVYNDASLILSDNLRKEHILKYMYNRPTYYNGYHICSIEEDVKSKRFDTCWTTVFIYNFVYW